MRKFGLKKIYLFFSSAFIFIIHIPFVFAKSRPGSNFLSGISEVWPVSKVDTSVVDADTSSSLKLSLYDSLRLGSLGLGRQVFDYAMKGFNFMKDKGKLGNDQVISIVDFSKSSSEKRLYVIDLKNFKVLFNTYVAHGMQSGKEFASQFSNKPESNKSSLGFYETLGTYVGGNGYSLRLEGIEQGINDNAGKRDIVIHGARYVDERLINSQGYLAAVGDAPPSLSVCINPSLIKLKTAVACLYLARTPNTWHIHEY